MTKAIEDELNLPRLEHALKDLADEAGVEVANEEVEAMANALQKVSVEGHRSLDSTGTDEHSADMDNIHDQAMKAHQDLLDLGFNIEPKHAGANAFMPSAKFLEIALKASQSKRTAKMDKIKAIMDQEKHRREMTGEVEDGEIIDTGGPSITANRNDLMDKIRKGEF
jgi:hypothetical protein